MTVAAARRQIDADVHSALVEAAALLEQQEQSARALKGSVHARTFSTVSTLRASMAQVAPSIFHVKHARRYNQELQEICCSEKLSGFEKAVAAQECIRTFENDAGEVAVAFLKEYLSDDPTIEWAEKEDVAFGACLAISILDAEGPAIATARHEQHMQYLLLAQQLAHLEHPLVAVCPRTLVTFQGRTMLVASEVGPAAQSSGAAATTGGPPDFARIPELKVALGIVSEACHLRRYYSADAEGGEHRVLGPAAASAFRAVDGRYYATGLAGLLPHFPPARGAGINKDYALHLRLEALCRADTEPLSPGAFVCHGTRDSAECASEVRACAAKVCRHHAPEVAAELDAMPLAPSGPVIVDALHRAGLNVGLLFVVFAHSTSTAVRAAILTEMAARCARDHLRETMAARIDEEDMLEAIAEFCGGVCGDDAAAAAVWNDIFVPRLTQKFPGFATISQQPGQAVTHVSLVKSTFLARLETLCGFRFAAGVNERGTSAFHFSVEKLSHVTKHFTLPVFRVGAGMHLSPGTVSPPMSPRGFHASTAALRARIAFVAVPTEAAVNDFLRQRGAISGTGGSDFVAACYDASFALARAGLIDAALQLVDKAAELVAGAAPHLRKSTIAALIKGQRGLMHIRKGNFGAAVKDLEAAVRQLNSAKLTVDSSLESPLPPDELSSSTMSSAAALRSSVYIPSQQTSMAAATFAKALAQLYEDRGLREEAEPHHRAVLETYRAVLGQWHVAVSSALNNLAVNLFAQEQFEEAEQLYLEDLSISEKLLGPQDLGVANTLNNLACLYDKLGRFSESEAMYKRDIAISTAVLGDRHPDVATSRNNLAASYFQQGRMDEAAAEYAAALELRKAYFGPCHVSVAESLNNIAALERRRGELERARALWEEALAIYEKCVGRNHHTLAPIVENVQSLAEELGDADRAEQLMEWAMDLKRADAELFNVQQAAVSSTGMLSTSSNREQL